MTRKNKVHDEFAEIMHRILKIHTRDKKTNKLTFMQIIAECLSNNNEYIEDITNEDLLDKLENI